METNRKQTVPQKPANESLADDGRGNMRKRIKVQEIRLWIHYGCQLTIFHVCIRLATMIIAGKVVIEWDMAAVTSKVRAAY